MSLVRKGVGMLQLLGLAFGYLQPQTKQAERKRRTEKYRERERERGTSQLHKQFMHNELYQWELSSRFSVF